MAPNHISGLDSIAVQDDIFGFFPINRGRIIVKQRAHIKIIPTVQTNVSGKVF